MNANVSGADDCYFRESGFEFFRVDVSAATDFGFQSLCGPFGLDFSGASYAQKKIGGVDIACDQMPGPGYRQCPELRRRDFSDQPKGG